MEYGGGIPINAPSLSNSNSFHHLHHPHHHHHHHHDTLWQMNLGPTETMDGENYPVRDGEPDCSYYIRTGLCRFGVTCRFNHPHNRKLAIATARMMGEYPERIGQPECQYYLKTGSCKFGETCKFHHPRDKAGIAGRVPVNFLGLPLRPASGMAKNGTVPLIEEGKTMIMVNESRRKLESFQICSLCTCCGGVKGLCLLSPCCYAINCNIPNRPFGFCSFTPKTCNCLSCHI